MPLAEVFSNLGDNQFFGAGFGLAILGSSVALLKRSSGLAYQVFQRYYVVCMEIPNTDVSYHWLLQWLARRRMLGSQHTSVHTILEKTDDGRVSSRFKFMPSTGLHFFWHNSRLVRVERNRDSKMLAGTEPFESVTLRTVGRDHTAFTDMLLEARNAAMEETANKTTMFKARGHEWQVIGTPRRKRPIESVVLAGSQANRIVQDVQEFLEQPHWYEERGIPYRRGYLFHGPPGCGKSSFIAALAGAADLSICVLSLSSMYLSNDVLDTLLSNAPVKSIILLEDVDAAFANRQIDPSDKRFVGMPSGVTFSGLLNALDGVTSSEGRILIMTTNHPERLDPALIRPGRVDVREEFTYCTKEQLCHMYERFYPGHQELSGKFADAIAKHGGQVSPAMVQGFFLLHKEDPSGVIDSIPTALDAIAQVQHTQAQHTQHTQV
ncbi:mitochondrial chaperone BCS1-like [Sycon ciliatum]|uniref:mitochondrial chaperone BCS1-like n=1 Tax=Sycon ciliatum TaxID=27933 RepID=UPI0020ACBE87|eukprot:scpid80981/ scgid13012/ Mitochondrial chaperone BCS1; BCS1-like protein